MSRQPGFLFGFLAAGALITQALAQISGAPIVVDGDSLEVAGQRFNLYGIDAPELGQVCRKASGKTFDCGRVARTALLDLTAGLTVVCQSRDEAGTPSPSTPSADCSAGGFSLARNMVHTGWAVPDRSGREAYGPIEEEARRAKRGLWRWQVAPPPWPEPLE